MLRHVSTATPSRHAVSVETADDTGRDAWLALAGTDSEQLCLHFDDAPLALKQLKEHGVATTEDARVTLQLTRDTGHSGWIVEVRSRDEVVWRTPRESLSRLQRQLTVCQLALTSYRRDRDDA